jgi:choline/glycine/proline betaine transport protein
MNKETRTYTSSNKKSNFKKYIDIYPPVFIPAALIIIVFIAITLIVGEPMETIFETIQHSIATNTGWFFVLVVNFFLFFMIYMAFSKYGDVRLGGKDARPEFTRMAWFAMLFSAGMGIGILFWSVAEPVFHYMNPAWENAKAAKTAEEAMNFTFLHWGLHAWGIYALLGMALAFFAFNQKLPLAIRSVFYPLFGDRINGPIGNIIEILAVIATVFGLATSLGFGVKQVNAGLNYLFDIPVNPQVQTILILIITLIATISVVSGLDSGVKRLSEININIGALLLAFILVLGPTLFILNSYVQNMGTYIQHFFYKSFWTESYLQTDWQDKWTIFYWAWWISWSPFVGMFIARISVGRTIREFVLGVLIVPTLLTFLWLTAFGGTAISLELNDIGAIAGTVKEDVSISLYALLDNFPLSSVTNLIAMTLVISFFVTSSDSGSLVVDIFTSGGKLETPVYQRVFWAFSIGGVAAVLLFGGGLMALQTAAITTGLPFAVILVVMSRSLFKGIRKEYYQVIQLQKDKEKESYKQLIGNIMKKNK